MKTSFINNKTTFLALSLVLSITVASCGPANYGTQPSSDSTDIVSATPKAENPSNPTAGTSTTGTATTPATTTTSASATSASKGIPAFIQIVEGIGYTNAVEIKVRTGKVLKLKFAPGAQNRSVAGTGFSPLYSKLGVYITVGSYTQPTEMLSNGYAGGAAQESHVMDFSTSFTNACSDSSCRQDVIIKISQPNYDYWCINYMMGCPWQKVHSTHPWNGTLTIQTDDTDAL
ncbi:hypothetical protein WDW86_15005 [Bdellovibrionota bacterium FG-2]